MAEKSETKKLNIASKINAVMNAVSRIQKDKKLLTGANMNTYRKKQSQVICMTLLVKQV